MKIGIIGLGAVGGTLYRWFEKNTDHIIMRVDPKLGHKDNLSGCDAIFVSVPVPSTGYGQDRSILYECIKQAKYFTSKVFIRSTVLPGTNDDLGTIALPEFLTERRADLDMDRLPVLFGNCDKAFADLLFPNKEKIFMSNIEAELAKFTHNCFGAMKVNYFNMISHVCSRLNIDFNKVKDGAFLTGFIEPTHTQVPGHDGQLGYGGKCFPENMQAFHKYLLLNLNMPSESGLIKSIEHMNYKYRTMGNVGKQNEAEL